MNESQVLFFILTSLLVILIPGQDLVLVMSRGMTQGAKAGIVTAAGVSVGLLGHTILAALGLGALITSSELTFTILKYIGAAYLSYLGLRLIFSRVNKFELQSATPKSLVRLFFEGSLSNLSNPKITLFYFAFLPQFISPEIHNPAVHLLTLGTTFAVLTFVVKAPIGLSAGTASMWIRSRPTVITSINRVSGLVLIGLGVKLAFEEL
ncbi:MAG: threonine/homoserine/homoserine lactone efflux protein [Parasphingorhabdus sp.]|jgi:threonine/homoserine/homoserine lactone efflux protein